MKLKILVPVFLLMLLSHGLLASPVIIPGSVCTDDAGAVVSPTSVTVTSVTDLDGNAIASPGANGHAAGPNISVVYDAALHGEAWLTLTPVLAGHTFLNYAKMPVFASVDSSQIAKIGTAASSSPTAPSWFPTDFLNAGEKGQIASASTAQQAGTPVTLPSIVLSAADIAAVQQAIMTYALHTGVSYQNAVAQIYLNTAGAATPTKTGTVQTNPFAWPDGTVGLTSTLDSSTGKRTELPGNLPN